ncbi:MAG: ImmA/IrrE family metallo-endopeptidase [bacterium]|nr:ImmA/IrrE family metallo-endopeptidase [bacterium]
MTDAAERWRDPEKLLRGLGIRRPEEIHVETIAYYTGARVIYGRPDGSGASTVTAGNGAIITVDPTIPREEQRFHAAHELCHWILDRGIVTLAHDDSLIDEVEWWDEEGEEVWISRERRADEWAAELLLPQNLLSDDTYSRPISFATVRDLGARYRTGLVPTARRLVFCASEWCLLLASRPGQATRCLERNTLADTSRLLEAPGPGTVARELLRGSREEPGSTAVPADGWFDLAGAWWFTPHEDSVLLPSGEVLSLLWWQGDGYETLEMDALHDNYLPAEPGADAVRQLVWRLQESWGYRRLPRASGEIELVTLEPSRHRLVIRDPGGLDAAGVRGLVDEVARHKNVDRDQILYSLVDLDAYAGGDDGFGSVRWGL